MRDVDRGASFEFSISLPLGFSPDLTANPNSELSPRSQVLVGIARWPSQLHNRETDSSQKEYGLAFSNQSIELGAKINDAEITNMDQLWGACRDWRSDRARDAADANKEDFALSRSGVEGQFVTRIAGPLSRYAFVNPRIAKGANAGVAQHQPGMRCEIIEQQDGGKQYVLQASVVLQGNNVPLTKLTLNTDAHGHPVEFNPQDPDSAASKMTHTESQHLPALMARTEELFKELSRPDLEPEQRMRGLAEMHWLLAHAMPDYRGSAAKSELAVRSMAHAMGMELRPFKQGIVPDLEAFLTPQAEFIEKYPALFEQKAPQQTPGGASTSGTAS
jgi:avirulence protein